MLYTLFQTGCQLKFTEIYWNLLKSISPSWARGAQNPVCLPKTPSDLKTQRLRSFVESWLLPRWPLFLSLFSLWSPSSFRACVALQAEILALRHQLAVLHKNAPRRLRLQWRIRELRRGTGEGAGSPRNGEPVALDCRPNPAAIQVYKYDIAKMTGW